MFTTEQVIARFRRWHAMAVKVGEPCRDAMAIGTVGPDGRVSVRMVLVKGVDARGFVFFTFLGSRKGRELAARPQIAATFYWASLGRQVRIEGRAQQVRDAEADAYWATRPRGSQLSAAVSQQSATLGSRAEIVRRRVALERRLAGAPVPRPPEWSGFRIVPDAIEFWTQKEDRLHHRELFERSRRGWSRRLLQP